MALNFEKAADAQAVEAEVTEVTVDPEEVEQLQAEAGDDEGIVTQSLRKPLNYEGKVYAELHFAFEEMTLRDGLKIEREVQLVTGSAVVLPAYNSDYLVRFCVHACQEQIGVDGMESLSIRDGNAVMGKARSFLLRSGS